MLGGLAALYRLLDEGRAAVWAQFAFALSVVGSALFMLGPMWDASVMPAIAQTWAEGPAGEGAAALRIAEAFYVVNEALLAPMVYVYLGSILLFGIALLADDRFPRWLGWFAVVLGIWGVGAGFAYVLLGPIPSPTLALLGSAPVLLLFVWAFILGVTMWRRGGAPDET